MLHLMEAIFFANCIAFGASHWVLGYWKAKAENIIKISNDIPEKVLDKVQDIKGFLE